MKGFGFRIPLWLLSRLAERRNHFGFLGDVEEMARLRAEDHRIGACVWLWIQVVRTIPILMADSFFWRQAMLKSYFKTALRNIGRHKGFTAINLLGMAVGLACCLFIFLYITFETSYDRYHEGFKRIYRVAIASQAPAGGETEPTNTPLLAPSLKMHDPRVEEAARLTQWSSAVVNRGEDVFREWGVRYADPELFSVLTIPFIHGDPKTALSASGDVVLTRSIAEKCFGTPDVIGKRLHIETILDTRDYRITGVVEDPPVNTHFEYRMFLSFETIAADRHMQGQHPVTITYMKLKPGVSDQEFEASIRDLSDRLIKGVSDQKEVDYTNILQPIADIYLHSDLSWEMGPTGNSLHLAVLSAIGVLILLVACVNTINLTTARAMTRANEVGMRKVVGARRSQVMSQLLTESFLITFLSVLTAWTMLFTSLPYLNTLAGTAFSRSALLAPKLLWAMFLLVLVTGVLSGLYPAQSLSRFSPLAAFRHGMPGDRRGGFSRRSLVVFQFAVSIALIAATLVVYRQLAYMRRQDLGFERAHRWVVPIPRGERMGNNYESIKEDFLKHPSVRSAIASSSVPGRGINVWWTFPSGEDQEKKQLVNCLFTDYDFLDDFHLEILAGRALNRFLRSDSAYGAILVNEATMRTFGWSSYEEALGQHLWDRRVPVVGVFQDFHWLGLKQPIEPLTIMVWPIAFRYMTLTLDAADVEAAMAHAREVFHDWFPDQPMEPFFLDASFDLQYRAEEQIGRVFSTFAFLGIFVAGLGLFGLASFIVQRRTKEIGVRKVLGASVPRIVTMLSGEFLQWVMLANFLAWPIAWTIMNRWLRDYAFRVEVGVSVFLLAALAAIVIALATVCTYCIRAALANPVESLRYE